MRIVPWLCCLALQSGAGFAQPKAVLSEGYESGQLDPKVWETRVIGAATVRVQQAEAAHRRYALQIDYPEMAAADG